MTYLYALAVLGGLGGLMAFLLIVADRFLANYGPCSITVNDREPFVVTGGGKLLEALYDQQIFLPSACGGQGTCGFCKCRVLTGGGPLLPTEEPYLTGCEIRSNTRLACQVKVKQDLTIHVRPDFLDVKLFHAKVASARMVTHDTREIVIDLLEPDAIDFHPGQYVQIEIPNRTEPTWRAYSISSPPSAAGRIELLVRLVPGGVGSTYLHCVEPGQDLTFTGPYGEFVLDPSAELVCVGGGCGLAPMRSILRHVRETTPDRPCWLFFGAKSASDLMYNDELDALRAQMPNLRIVLALSEPAHGDGWTGPTGFIHERLEADLADGAARQAFLCGPPVMIDATRRVLQAKQVPAERIFADEF